MRYLFIVFQDFRMCFFDNGLPRAVTCEHSSISITTSRHKLRITALSSFHWRDQIRTAMSQVNSPATSRSSRRARPRHLRGNDLRVIVTQPLRKLITFPQAS